MAGYSGTPLVKKLGIKNGVVLFLVNAPPEYLDLVSPLPDDVKIVKRFTGDTDMIHIFSTKRLVLQEHLLDFRKKLKSDATIWVSWPKRSARVETDITEDVIRELALPLGFVDIKVCAVNEIWSGLKLVIRKELRN